MTEITPKQREVKHLGVGGVHFRPGRLRPLRPEAVKEIAKSMEEVGQLQPIAVRPAEGRAAGYWLIAGRHRLEAAKRLHWASIQCVIFDDLAADEAELAEVDENLIRAELTAAERALHITRRKQLYEALHPETKPTKSGGRNRRQNGDDARFTKDAAERTGKPERSIQRDATRGKKLGDDLARIIGTSLDKGSELDALAQMTPAQRAPLIAAAEAGETVTAIATPPLAHVIFTPLASIAPEAAVDDAAAPVLQWGEVKTKQPQLFGRRFARRDVKCETLDGRYKIAGEGDVGRYDVRRALRPMPTSYRLLCDGKVIRDGFASVDDAKAFAALGLADALANAQAEIERLRSENERLRAEVQALKRGAVRPAASSAPHDAAASATAGALRTQMSEHDKAERRAFEYDVDRTLEKLRGLDEMRGTFKAAIMRHADDARGLVISGGGCIPRKMWRKIYAELHPDRGGKSVDIFMAWKANEKALVAAKVEKRGARHLPLTRDEMMAQREAARQERSARSKAAHAAAKQRRAAAETDEAAR